MNTPPQFTRNADGFFLEVELTQSLNFLLVSTNEDLFFELRVTQELMPATLKSLLPTLNHLYLYLLKNHNHPRAFRVDQKARLHLTIPVPNQLPISVVLDTHPITKDNIMPEEEFFSDELDGKGFDRSLDSYFLKKKGKGKENQCLDLQNGDDTLRTDSNSGRLPDPDISVKNRLVCRQVESLLSKGCSMGKIRRKMKLSDRTAFKMCRQYQKFKRIFSPEEGRYLRQSQRAIHLLKQALQQDNQLCISDGGDYLTESGIIRPVSFIKRVMSSVQVVFYSQSSECGQLQ